MKEPFRPIPESASHFEANPRSLSEVDLHPRETLDRLQASVIKHNHFSPDRDDEFQIHRETGEVQGIFKVWAAPIIPELEGTTIEAWSQGLRERPLALFESLEQWRGFSDVADRRLQQVFAARQLPEEPEAVMGELFLRLHHAFAFAAPFYNLEALIADSREIRPDNPIDIDRQETGSGKLDLVAMALPSAMEDLLIADRLNWNEISWELLQDQVAGLKQSFLAGEESVATKQFKLIARIAATAGLKPEEVLFTANALQFIPVSVGGKRGDLERDQSLVMLGQMFEQPQGEASTSSVAQEMNALIRFLNWSTSIQSPENFQGKFWRYDAVCASASTLLDLIKQHPEAAFEPEFAGIFVEQLAPQLDNLDATSAKGRFLMQLLLEGKFKPTIPARVLSVSESFTREVSAGLEMIKTAEMLVDLGEPHSPFLVGGKAVGITRAMQLFPEQMVQEGKVITSEAVGAWLGQIEGFDPLVARLRAAETIDEKIQLGQEVRQLIAEADIPPALLQTVMAQFALVERMVLRSSSFDEDIDIVGPAPGIYESAIDVDPRDAEAVQAALKTTVSSFFSEKAIGFREIRGLRHVPLMAVIAQEFVDAPGGSVFINGGQVSLNIAANPSQINSVGSYFEKHEFVEEDIRSAVESQLLTPQQILQIRWATQKAQEVFGPTDMEFVLDPETGGMKILQMRSLDGHVTEAEAIASVQAETTIPLEDLESLPDLEGEAINLRISNAIDLETFQGQLFRWIIANNNKIVEITLGEEIPRTCHFANIVGCLGIKLTFAK